MATVNPNDPAWAKHIASQDFNLTDITGTVNTFSLSDVDSYYFLKSRSLIVFGVEIGLCIMLTIVLLLLTKPEKRRTLIFGLNIAGLILETIRFITTAINYNSQIFTIGVQFLGARAQLPSDFGVAIDIYSVMTILWYAVVEASLVLQVRVVFGAERKLQTLLTVVLGFLFTVTAGLKIAQQAMLFRAQLHQTGIFDNPAYDGINLAGRVLFAITVGISSAIFVAKLVYLIHRRQKMGFHAFGPLQVILIMAAQCLLVPRNPPPLSFPYPHLFPFPHILMPIRSSCT
jgi:pheromone alpha factor receptor